MRHKFFRAAAIVTNENIAAAAWFADTTCFILLVTPRWDPKWV